MQKQDTTIDIKTKKSVCFTPVLSPETETDQATGSPARLASFRKSYFKVG